MKSIEEIINEAKSSGKVFLVLHCNNKDNIRNDYYFWTSLPEEDTKIVNYQYPSDKLKEVLQHKFPKIWKEVEEIIEYAGSRDSKARVWTERLSESKIKKL
jgi:hypothetical protein